MGKKEKVPGAISPVMIQRVLLCSWLWYRIKYYISVGRDLWWSSDPTEYIGKSLKMIKFLKTRRDYKQLSDTCIHTSLNLAREIYLKLVQGEKWDSCAEKFVMILFQSFSTTFSIHSKVSFCFVQETEGLNSCFSVLP